MNIRSRLVAKHVNTGEEALFAAAPPLEALRMMLPPEVTGPKPMAMIINDISREYMHATATNDTFVDCAIKTLQVQSLHTRAAHSPSQCTERLMQP